MAYRDDTTETAKCDQLAVHRDEALARVERLEIELAEARVWLKNRRPPGKGPKAIAWAGFGSLGGSVLGTGLWLALENPFLIPIATILGALLVGLSALGVENEDDGVGGPPPPAITGG